MSELFFEGDSLEIAENETVLECLERNGHRVASSCRSGICQSCLMQGTKGAIPEAATRELSPAQRAQGYFLACVCRPADALEIRRIDPERLQVFAKVLSSQRLSERTIELRVQPETSLSFYAGQFFNLVLPDGTRRSYSAAAAPGDDGSLTFHIGLMPGGKFSGWVAETAEAGDLLMVQGPLGKCCYVPGGDSAVPLLLAGTGTGLAPLYGIAQAAIQHRHTGEIWLFHGALDPSGLYLHEQLKQLARLHPNLHYSPCVLRTEEGTTDAHVGDLQAHVFEKLPKLSGHHVYLCGHPDFVKTMQRKVFLAGASLREIFADAFLPAIASSPVT